MSASFLINRPPAGLANGAAWRGSSLPGLAATRAAQGYRRMKTPVVGPGRLALAAALLALAAFASFAVLGAVLFIGPPLP